METFKSGAIQDSTRSLSQVGIVFFFFVQKMVDLSVLSACQSAYCMREIEINHNISICKYHWKYVENKSPLEDP